MTKENEFKDVRSEDHSIDYEPSEVTKRLVLDYVAIENNIKKIEKEILDKQENINELRNYIKIVLSNIFIPLKKELLKSVNGDEDFRILRVVVNGKLYTISNMMIDKFDVSIL